MPISEPDVLVAGAGPVGLFTALALERHGLSVRLVEEGWRAAGRSYALALHPESLQRMGELGLLEPLLAAGLRIDVVSFYDGAERRRERRLDATPARHPFLLALPQGELERILGECLQARGVEVEWNHRVAAFEEAGERLAVDVQKLEKVSSGYAVAATEWAVHSVQQARPRVLVGADGHRSTVRNMLRLDFDPQGPSELYAVFEFEAEDGPSRNEARFTTDALGTSALWPLPGERWRWSVPLVDEGALRWRSKSRLSASAGDPADLEVLARLLGARLPWFGGRPTRVHWMTVARFERRTASAFGRGRVWLVGDAAHVGGPLGVHSMNAGLREGSALAGCVASMVHGTATADILPEYGRSMAAAWSTVADQPIPLPAPGPAGAPARPR